MPKKKQRELTDVEIHFIKTNPNSLSLEQMAQKLELPVEMVESHFIQPESRTLKSFNRKAAGGRKGVVAMTQAASELGEVKSSRKKDTSSYIHKPFGDNY